MSTEIFQGLSLREYGNHFVNGQEQEVMQVIFAFCEVEYAGRGESYLDTGERMLIWKPDGNFQVVKDEKFKPVNYQPTGAETTVEFDDENELLRFTSERTSPNETLTVECPVIYSIVQYDADDTAEIDLIGTESDVKDAVLTSPSLIEEGFSPVDDEYDIGLGAVDIFGHDSSGTPVIVELKRRKAQIKHIDQLHRYVEWFRDNESETVRGILVAPDMSAKATELLSQRGLEFIEIDPLTVS